MSEAPALLKTCQTCFHAKIRCEKTQDSGLCDRCLRLGKPCVFAPSRRRKAQRTVPVVSSSLGAGASAGRLEQPEASSSTASVPPPVESSVPQGTPEHASTPDTSSQAQAAQDRPDTTPPYSAFARGMLTFDKGQVYLDLFRTKMITYFPFVLIPETMSIRDLDRDKPCLCLAVMCAASATDPRLQKVMGELFSEMVAMRLIKNVWFYGLDLLQGLLVVLAWAHFLPRPLRYSQHLSLAASIVADMRLDRPRITALWSLNEDLMKSDNLKLTADEMRALAGTYYLASSTSVLMQKARMFKYTPYILKCCHRITAHGGKPTDKYLPYIIYLQKLIEELDDAVSMSHEALYLTTELQRIKEMYLQTKTSLPFALSESPTIQQQLHVLELLICQPSPDSVALGPNGFQNVQVAESSNGLLDWLSQSLAAAKSIISVFLTLPGGEEGLLPNMSWVVLYSSASLAVRLDLLAAHYDMGHLRRILDMTYTLRQIRLRLESAAGFDSSPEVPRNAFYHLNIKAQQVERWYLHHTSTTSSPSMGSMFSSSSSSPSSNQPVEAMAATGFTSAGNLVPNVTVASDPDSSWTAATAMEFDPGISMGNMLFTGSFEFLSDPNGGPTGGQTDPTSFN